MSKPYRTPTMNRYGDVAELTKHLVHIGTGDNFLGLGGVLTNS